MHRSALSIVLGGVFLVAAAGGTAPAKGPANACGVQTHARYDETRAFFRHVMATCRPDGTCSVISNTLDPRMPVGMSHQLRIEVPAGGEGPLGLNLTAVEPNANMQAAMTLRLGRRVETVSDGVSTRDNVGNQFHLEPALADRLARTLARSTGQAVWRYSAEDGSPAQAAFSMRGAGAALAWAQCMARAARR